MNTNELDKAVNLTDDMFQSETEERGFIKKLTANKRLLIRRTFLFFFGFTFYLIYSSL